VLVTLKNFLVLVFFRIFTICRGLYGGAHPRRWRKGKAKGTISKVGKFSNVKTFLPAYLSQPVFLLHWRYYTVQTGYTSTFYSANLLYSLIMSMGTTSNDVVLSAIRLKRIKLTAFPLTTAPTTGIAWNWLGVNSPNIECSSVGNAVQPAIIDTSPPNGCAAWWWYSVSDSIYALAQLYTDSLLGDLFIDVWFESVLGDGPLYQKQITTGSSGTAGAIYTSALDCLSNPTTWNTTPKLLPMNRVTLA